MNRLHLAAAIFFFLSTSVASAQTAKKCADDVRGSLAAALAKRPKDLSSTVSDAHMCVIKFPASAEVKIVLAMVHRENGSPEKAVEELNKVLASEPSNPEAVFERGRAYFAWRRKDYTRKDLKDLVLADLDKAVTLDPKNARAILESVKARRYDIGSGFSATEPDLNKALEIARAAGNNKLVAEVLMERGRGKQLDAKYTAAIEDYTATLVADPTLYSAYEYRSLCHWALKNYSAQLDDLTKYITSSPQPSSSVLSQRAQIYEDRGEREKAIEDLRAVTRMDPTDGNAKERLAALLKLGSPSTSGSAAGDPNEAIKKAEGFARLGRQHAEKQEWAAAIQNFDECIKLKPDAAACYMFRGGVHAQTGNELFAIVDLNKAVELSPKHPAVYWTRGLIYSQFGKKNEAITDFRKVVSLDPNNQQAKAMLQRLGVQ